MQTVTRHGRRTAYRQVEGEDPTTLYIHGSGATHHGWVPQYGANRTVDAAAALDLSGHGASEDISADEDAMAEYVQDVVAVAEAVGADVLVGASLGGAVVLTVVIEDHYDPAGVVLAGSGAKLAVREDLRAMLDSEFEAAIEFLHEPDRLFHDVTEDRLAESKATLRETGQRVVRRDFLTAHRFDVRDRLDAVDVPLLALVGEHDQLTPPAYHEYLADGVPEGEWATVEDAAHLAMLERPSAFNRQIADFVAGLD